MKTTSLNIPTYSPKNYKTELGYKSEHIEKIRNTVSHTDRPNLLNPKSNRNDSDKSYPLIVFSTEYTSHLEPQTIKTALTKYWGKIENNTTLKAIFPKPPLIAFRRAKNVQDTIVRAKLPPDQDLNILIELMNE